MLESIVSGLLAGYGLAIPVGAVAVLMINTVAGTSFQVGVGAALGAAAADAVYAVAAVVGGAVLADAIRPVMTPMRLVAGAVLVAMAVRICWAGIRERHSTGSDRRFGNDLTPGRAFLGFFGLTALNPWPAVYFVALVLGRGGVGAQGPGQDVVYVAAIVVASASWQLLLAGGGVALGRILDTVRGRTVSAVVSGLVIGGLGLGIAITT